MGKHKSMKRIIFIAIIILASISMINSVKSIYSLWKKQDVLVLTKKELEKDQKKNLELKKELQIVSKDQFVEEEARNKLFMSKPGEDTIYISKDLLSTESAKIQARAQDSNWLAWWKLFF
jgi:cell division protein FtsB